MTSPTSMPSPILSRKADLAYMIFFALHVVIMLGTAIQHCTHQGCQASSSQECTTKILP